MARSLLGVRVNQRWPGYPMLPVLLSLFAFAHAADPLDGRVLRVDGAQVYVDLGRKEGATQGLELELLQRVEVTDPASSRQLVDYFPLGTLRVVQAGETLSMLQGPASLVTRVQVGDRVRGEAGEHVAGPSELVGASAPGSDVEVVERVVEKVPPDLKAFANAFNKVAGQAPLQRITTWETFALNWPASKLEPVARKEIEALRALAESLQTAEAAKGPAELVSAVAAPTTAVEGQAVPIVVTVPEAGRVTHASLHFRRNGEPGFRFVAMTRRGDASWQAEVPAEAVTTDGVEWFVIVQDDEGGEQRRPAREFGSVDVSKEASGGLGIRNRSQVSLFYEYVDFYALQGVDRFSHFEADFLYRIDSPLRAVRVGYGVRAGTTGVTGVIDEAYAQSDGPAVKDGLEADGSLITSGFNFGYAELEFGGARWFGVSARGIVGVEPDGLSAGLEGRMRLGREEGTSLVLGAARIGTLGENYLLQLNWDTVPKVPMAAGVHVTNLPAAVRSDYGVRLVYEARYELTDWVEVGGRVGYQFRNIFHSGPSFGAGTVFKW